MTEAEAVAAELADIATQNEEDLAKLQTVGEIVIFGHYEQDGNTDNGPEPIEWIVLDVQDGKSLLISRYGLDCQIYHSQRQYVTWDISSLRTWLNRAFLDSAFFEKEKEAILTTKVDNSAAQGNSGWPTNGGSNTADKIFLLSYAEADTLFASEAERICEATEYAKLQGAYTGKSGNCRWWLRSPGLSQDYAAFADIDGMLSTSADVRFAYDAVRPAFWIDRTKIEEQKKSDISLKTIALEREVFRTVGETVLFGSYEQDNDLTNGPEPIEWIVLDQRNGQSLLISRYILDCKSFNDKTTQQYTWDKSGLRRWLNNDFLNEAFSNAEQKLLQEMLLENAIEDSGKQIKGGSDTKDRVFLLSKSEVLQYFPGNEDRVCTAKKRAIDQGLSTGENGSGWWLRAPGYVDSSIYWNKYIPMRCIDDQGCLVYRTSSKLSGIRPAIWINLGAVEDVVSETAIQKTWELLHKKGSTITFGRYEQDNNLDNGQEPIEWTVLDVQEGKALLISNYALDSQVYKASRQYTTWELCDLRAWLNGTFLKSAFQTAEQGAIPYSSIDNSPAQHARTSFQGGNNTKDRIFLLSYQEANKYYEGNEARICKPTDFAIAQGAEVNSDGNCWWWLRSPSGDKVVAAVIFKDGSFDRSSVNMLGRAVRPAMWIDLNSDYFQSK